MIKSRELGDACDLDVEHDRYDRAVCQTVLVHQGDARRILREMARVVKPGGLVVAIEPDLSRGAPIRQDGIATPEHELDCAAVQRHINAGAQAIGAGDYAVVSRLPALFSSVGLQAPRAWLNPTVIRCAPPWHAAGEAYRQVLLDRSHRGFEAEERQAMRPLFDAGGGDAVLWNRVVEGAEVCRQQRRRQLLAGTYASVVSSVLVVCVARAP